MNRILPLLLKDMQETIAYETKDVAKLKYLKKKHQKEYSALDPVWDLLINSSRWHVEFAKRRMRELLDGTI